MAPSLDTAAPRFPGMPRYPEIADGLRALNLRHVGELISPEAVSRRGPGFQILDGYRVRRPGNVWYLVDGPLLAQARKAAVSRHGKRVKQVHRLFDLLTDGSAPNIMNLRHLLLYQLLTLLGEQRGQLREQDVTHLGVVKAEAPGVLALATAIRPFDARARQAAETLLDTITAGRVRAAAELASAIPAGHEDERLARLCSTATQRPASVSSLIKDGELLAGAGDPHRAAEALRRAANRVPDDPRARIKLFELALSQADGRVTIVPSTGAPTSGSAAGGSGGVVVRCAPPRTVPPGEALEYEFWRLVDGDPRACERLWRVADPTEPLTDVKVRFGDHVAYAVLPLHAGRICGPAVASAPYRHAPDVASVRLAAEPDGVRARWRAPYGTREIRVTRLGPGPGNEPVAVEAGPDGFHDPVSEVGEYRYEVRCGFAAPDGGQVWSAGWSGTVSVARWPGQVEILEAELVGGGADDLLPGKAREILVIWRAAAVGDCRMTVWPFTPRARGRDVSTLIDALPAALGYETVPEFAADGAMDVERGEVRSTVVVVPQGRTVRLTGVSELGRRAVAGDSVLICLPNPASGDSPLSVDHVDARTAKAVFRWPEPAALVRLTVEQNGSAPRQWILPRNGNPAGELSFRADGAAAQVVLQAQLRPDADIALPETFAFELAALPLPPKRETTVAPFPGAQAGTYLVPPDPVHLSPARRLIRTLRRAWRAVVRYTRRGLRTRLF